MFEAILMIVLVGCLVTALNSFIPMSDLFKRLLNLFAALFLFIYIAKTLGLLERF